MKRILIAGFLAIFLLLNNAVVAQESNNAGKEGYITGVVTDASTGKALAGIHIDVPGLASTITDDNGAYSLKLSNPNAILQVSGFGYARRDVSLRGRTNINISLYEESFKNKSYDSYAPAGNKSQTSSPYSWATIQENTDLSVAVTPDLLMQGYASGVNTLIRSGLPGNSAAMFLHGFNTINAGTMPLFVVDGMPYENTDYSSSLIGNYEANPLASIDPKDIESITILKDGSSIYGVKAANGVVLIKTKKVQQLATKINAHVHTGINFEPTHLPVMNAAQQKSLLSDIQQTNPALTAAEISSLPYFNNNIPVKQAWGYEGNPDYYRYNHNTDWQNEIYNNASYNQDYYLNVSGGDEVATYMLSLGFLTQQGTVKNTDFQRFNTRFNSEIHLTKDMDFLANMSFVYGTKNYINEGANRYQNPILSSLLKSPFTAAYIYNEEGEISPNKENIDVFGNSNPYVLTNNLTLVNVNYRFLGSFGLRWMLNRNLNVQGILGLNFNKEREKVFYPSVGVAFDPLYDEPVFNEMQHRVDRLFSLFGDIFADYNKSFNANNNIAARVGLRYQNNKAEDDYGKSYNSGSDSFKSIQYGQTLLNQLGGSIGSWNWLSVYANVDYALQNKYFFNISGAADATSRSGIDAPRMFIYPSVGAAWLLSGEKFLKDATWLNTLKIRASYGLAGNDEIGNYTSKYYYQPQNQYGMWGLVRGNLVNSALKPEKIERINVGFDLAVANQRINLSLDLYHNTIRDMILLTKPNTATGYNVYLDNAGSMRNTGIDLSINARIINSKFKWDLGVMASAYRNEILDLAGEDFTTDILGASVQTKTGQPLGLFYGYQSDGVYATQAQATQDGLHIIQGLVTVPFAAGDTKFVNQNTDNLINDDDRVVIGNPNPDVFGSITNTFKYGKWTLNALMVYSLGNDVYNYTRTLTESGAGLDNQSIALLNRWRSEGDVTTIPRVAYGDPMGNARFSDRWIEDGSYLRMKSLTLAYDLSINWSFIQSCIIFSTGENLFTLTRYKGLDPEFSSGQNPLYYGIDACVAPQPRTVSLGIKLSL
ncbi:MAG: SusC/RagA family TonB-linked outer membrane protein [Paludibacter sp.]|jgi:TonB-linked SusC/RagA family outer membrane protein|nr:SusC/RagA family TonB-linked outer membrane protein [Paludibacter sp.]